VHNEDLHNFYSSPNITGVIRSNKIKWMGDTAYMGEMRNAYKVFLLMIHNVCTCYTILEQLKG
jgi:hypothetical protein